MPIKPMLACPPKGSLRFPLLAQPKIDGVRALTVNSAFQSRSGKPFANKNLSALAEILPSGLDGELIVAPGHGEGTCRATTSIVNSLHGDLSQLIYIIYDVWDTRHRPPERLAILADIARSLPSWCSIIETSIIETQIACNAYEAACIAAGYEGIILRAPSAAYKHGRAVSSDQRLLKLKQFEDAEAVVCGIEEEMHNGNFPDLSPLGYTSRTSHQSGKTGKGSLGALIVRWNNQLLRIGTGFTAQDRREFWLCPPIGRLVKFKFQPHGMKDLPRSPVFISFRDSIDLTVL